MNMSEPLTPEERELARLLGRPAADLAPSAGTDAAIAALAREPSAAPPPRPSAPPAAFTVSAPLSRHRRRRGLVSSLAVAASLVLVVGLAWQLRPVPPSVPPPPLAAPTAAQEAPAADAASGGAMPAPPAAPEAAAARPAPPPPPVAPVRAAKAEARSTPRQESAPSPARAAAAPPPPPAPPASASYVLEPAPVVVEAPAQQAAPAAMRLRSSAPQPLADGAVRTTGSVLREQASVAVVAPDGIDEDARLPRRKWLERIRSRRDEGDADAARASLARFVQAYPEARIPRDLRPLLAD